LFSVQEAQTGVSPVGVSLFQHGGEAGGFHLPALSGAGLFEAAMQPKLLERLFAVQFLLEAPDGALDWFSLS
jgi:hypothetical protein